MGLRFRKRIKILPGLWFNLSKSGISTSIGGKGLTVNLKDGKTRTTVGIPGSGLSYNETTSQTPSTVTPVRQGVPSWFWLLLVMVVVMISFSAFASDLPDSTRTPGAIDPTITQQNIHSTVCIKGYTKTIRPPASYTNKLKKRQIRQYGYEDRNPKHYEEDHLIPLSIGGHPTDPGNLWPEPRLSEWGAAKKDDLEFALYKMVCKNEIGLKEAQGEIASDWIAAYKKYVHLGKGRRHGRRVFGHVN